MICNTSSGGPSDDSNDVLAPGPGKDRADGGAGSDTVDYRRASRPVVVRLANGLATAEGRDTLRLVENVEGSPFDDTIVGDARRNVLGGGRGHDTLRGGGGNDVLRGGQGNDTMVGQGGRDVASDNRGNNTCVTIEVVKAC